MLRNFSTVRWAGLLGSLLWGSLGHALTIFYPGSFDIFHRTHFNEVAEALKKFPDAKIVILPITNAYYNAQRGSFRPPFMEHEFRAELIKKAFPDSNVQVSDALQQISNDVFGSIERAALQWPDPDKAILVGSDVIDIWVGLPGFDAFGEHMPIVLSRDANMPNQRFAALKGHVKKLKATVSPDHLGLRSASVNAEIFSGTIPDHSLPPKIAEALHANPERLRGNLEAFRRKSREFVSNNFASDFAEWSQRPPFISLPERWKARLKEQASVLAVLVDAKSADSPSVRVKIRKLQREVLNNLGVPKNEGELLRTLANSEEFLNLPSVRHYTYLRNNFFGRSPDHRAMLEPLGNSAMELLFPDTRPESCAGILGRSFQ